MIDKVLIIDGDVNFLYGLERKFAISDINVITCDGSGDIEDILHILRQEKIYFIILDLNLPKYNGLEVLEKIKAEPNFLPIPFFIFTFNNDKQTKDRAKNLGVSHYFLKADLGLDEFIIKVQKILFNQNKIKNLMYEN
jgi:DNA-binding NarL/FixJ family response regulator